MIHLLLSYLNLSHIHLNGKLCWSEFQCNHQRTDLISWALDQFFFFDNLSTVFLSPPFPLNFHAMRRQKCCRNWSWSSLVYMRSYVPVFIEICSSAALHVNWLNRLKQSPREKRVLKTPKPDGRDRVYIFFFASSNLKLDAFALYICI